MAGARRRGRVCRVALGQFSGSDSWHDNLQKATAMAVEAADNGAHLITYPEVANSVYMAWENDPRHFAAAELDGGFSVTTMRKVAKETGMVIAYPFFERDDGGYFNTVVVIDCDGTAVAKYRKTTIPWAHQFEGGDERFYFTPGERPPSAFDTSLSVRIGVVICYERNLPEPARCAALAGAELLVVPVASQSLEGRRCWELLLRALAIQNGMYVAACNRVGEDRGGAPGAAYFGRSIVVDPRGDVLVQASDDHEEIVYADVDPLAVEEQRRRRPFLDDRRPDMYAALTRPRPVQRPQGLVHVDA